MGQLKFDANITASAFPLLTDWATRTVLVASTQSGEGRQLLTTPQILYAENVLPTNQGYKSVTIKDIIPAATPANTNFTKIFNVTDAAGNKALLGVTSDSKIYMITASTFIWVDVTPATWAGGDEITLGRANGTTYIYLKQFGCYVVDITGVALTVQALAGITAANIYGIVSAVNYLILWDATALYWSSTVDPTDFVPSLITGAGTETPTDLEGTIVYAQALGTGFAIYSTVNIVLASYSNNTQFPWIFRAADNGDGIIDSSQVGNSQDSGYQMALTPSGVLQVTPQGCQSVTPEISDFLAAKLYEEYNSGLDSLVTTELSSVLIARISYIAARYIILSYGITSYTAALVYDQLLKRWGKLKLDHAACYEIQTPTGSVLHSYGEASELGQSYASATPQPYNEAASTFNGTPDIGTNFGFMKTDGSLVSAQLDFTSIDDSGFLILGKFQAVRSNLITLEEIELESLSADNTAFELSVRPSIDGKTLLAAVTPTLLDSVEGYRRYGLSTEGKNHELRLKGSFNLTVCEITYTMAGRR